MLDILAGCRWKAAIGSFSASRNVIGIVVRAIEAAMCSNDEGDDG